MRVDLIENIKEKFTSLSKGQKLIAEYIIENYDKAAFMTAASIGEIVGVSESTVVRFATTIGYEGYKDLRNELHELIKTKLTTVQRLSMTEKYSNKENALKKAEFYQEHMSMSPSAIYDLLVSEYGEQFTAEEAQYAVDNLN